MKIGGYEVRSIAKENFKAQRYEMPPKSFEFCTRYLFLGF